MQQSTLELQTLWDETNNILSHYPKSHPQDLMNVKDIYLSDPNNNVSQNEKAVNNKKNEDSQKAGKQIAQHNIATKSDMVQYNEMHPNDVFGDVSYQAAKILKENPMYLQTMGQPILQNTYRYASSACFGQDDESVFKGRGTGGLTRKKDDICNQQSDNVTSIGIGNYMLFWDKYIPRQKCVDNSGVYYHAASSKLVDIDSQMKGLDIIKSKCYDRFPITPKKQIIIPDQTICADAHIGVPSSEKIMNVDHSMKLGYQLLR